MPKVLVLFYSRTGNTARIADALVEGARAVKFTEVDVRRVDDLAPPQVIESVPEWAESHAALARRYRPLEGIDRLEQYDGIVLGAPTRYGVMAAELKNVIDQTETLWKRGALVDKVGSAFTSASNGRSGHETAVWSIMTTMANLGMILCPPGYSDSVVSRQGHGRGAEGANEGGAPGEADLEAARQLGRRVATVTGWVHHAKGHTAHGHSHAHAHSHSH